MILRQEIQDDLRGVALMAGGLWGEKEPGDLAILESYSALTTVQPDLDRRGVKLASVLLLRANREGIGATATKKHDPFYRLEAESRLVLVGLHRAQWSYSRLAEVLGVSVDRLQEIAWTSRVHLAYSPDAGAGSSPLKFPKALVHPTGSPLTGSRCPDYHPGRPWTQRYLDGDSSPQEKLFLETHLRSCPSCLKSIEKARELYYRAERMVPRLEQEATDRWERVLKFATEVEAKHNPLSQGLISGFLGASQSVVRGLRPVHYFYLVLLLGLAWAGSGIFGLK